MWKALEVKIWQRFGKWTALAVEKKWTKRLVKCQCECWYVGYVTPSQLIGGKNNSCYRCSIVTHRLDCPRMYCIRDKMKQRCNNPRHTAYHNYGGRWIKIERKTFDEFYEDMYQSYEYHVNKFWEKDTTIERIDWNGNYCKENCRWATRSEQNNNQRRTHHIQYKWKSYTSLSDLCRCVGADYQLARDRLRRWYTIEDCIEKPRLYIRKKDAMI